MGNITQKDNSAVGHDRTEAFCDWDVDLFIFFDGFFDDIIYVDGTSGMDKEYCGIEKAPCYNVNYGIGHLKNTQNTKKEIIVISNSLMAGCVDVGGLCVKAKEEEMIRIECQREVSGSEECILKSSSLTEMKFIGIIIPSSFSRTITSVIESNTQNGKLHMNNCEMSVAGGNGSTITFFLIKSTGMMVKLEFVTISDVKSTVPLFSFTLSSSNMNDQEYKVKLLNCSLQRLEIDSTTAVDEKASVFGESVGVGMVINGSTIDGALSEKSKEGGALKIALNAGGFMNIQESSFVGCVCENENDGGKGGGIYLDCSSNEVGFQLSSISFSGCSATVGKNMFAKSGNLVNSVKTERFAFDYSGYSNDGNAFVGEDGIYGEMDLRVFLVSLKWIEVSVSTGGHDTLGCGIEKFPCKTMKSGIDHIDRSGTEGKRKVTVKDGGTIEDIYSFTDELVIDGCVNNGDIDKRIPIHFEETIKGNSASTSSVISSTQPLSLLSLKLQIPNQFVPSKNSLILSSRILQLENCLFEIHSAANTVQYTLISTTTGSCTLKGCSLADCSFIISPLVMASSVLFENNSFSSIANTGSGEGGVARVILKENEEFVIKSTNVSSCSLSSSNGKGGFLYLNCENYDDNLFVGSDDFHQKKDLFMFLIPYSSFEIFISFEGFDVARCGSEEEPCKTMWKGMKNMETGDDTKTIQISGSTIIQDSFSMSNYQIKKASSMGEENVKAILNFEKAIGSQLEYFMVNEIHLELSNIQLQLKLGFDNSAKTIISNINGDLVITGCSFHSEAGINNGFDCVFVDAIGGSVEVNDLSIESSNVGNSIFAINNAGVSCHFVNVRVKLLNESGGCLLLIKGSESTTKINEGGEEGTNIEIEKSSFSGIKRSDNGPSILESKSEKKICLVVKESNITEDKAENSEKGGAIFFTLGSSGSMNMIDSKITNCNCSISSGKGGGVYLVTKERGDLNFSFVGMKFSDNGASVGKDIFIECYNITSQINETQFRFDLRENHYSRINAIYGIDECQYTVNTDLIRFVTIHQSDTIVVSGTNGSNDRQCGTNDLPCDSINHGLMHLTSEYVSLLYVDTNSVIGEEINLEEMSLSSKSREMCEVEVETDIRETRGALMATTGTVSLLRVNFVFDPNFISSHESLISPEGGILEIMNCSFSSKLSNEDGNIVNANIPFNIIKMDKGELQLDGCAISNLILHESALYLSSPLPSVIYLFEVSNITVETSLIDINECGQLTIKDFNTENITAEGNEESLISCLSMKKTMQLANCTIGEVSSKTKKGKLMKLENCLDVKMDSCIFDGSLKERNEKQLNIEEEMCRWDGSLVDVVKSSMVMKVSTITNSPEGGITMRGGNVIIEKGEFIDNNPSIETNVICSDSGTLNVMSLKGGDGVLPNTSLWMLNEGCGFEGIVSERDSSFFIPVLESVETKEEASRMKLTFKGMLLVPCNLSFSLVKRKGEEKEIEKYDFDSNGFLSEKEAEGSVAKDLISGCGNEIEVSVHILFGVNDYPSSTNPFILKNSSVTPPKDDEIISKGEIKIEWSLFAFIGCVAVVIILLFVIVVVIVLMRRKLREAERKAEAADSEAKQIMEKIERRRENNGGCIEMSEMPSTLLEGMTSQIPLLIDNDEEDLPEPPSMSDDILNENDLPDLESPFPFSENDSVSDVQQSHSFNVISTKKPFREKEKKNIKTLHSVIHSVQGDFTLGTRAMDVVDGKQVVKVVAELFEHLISVVDERMEMMARQLCPYSIFVEEGNNEIFVLTEELEDVKEKEEMKRWKAPEVGNEDEGIEKRVVFTLGLILHEMTTGEVPLSECDAEEAQEMMRDGVRPLTEGIEGEELIELMEKMWADEPKERPTLGEVIQSLVEITEIDEQ
eukprot:MONOS_9191.1-p1 / transcript=MONOS_9191.1 / gene=MONOS_9191 / organism=Monocercomonoides_exilis_PA203 / gene_product=unspecified product / transcript_product=unspecified product / location=Mono_scaffold00370:49811-55918(-) / protein_length=1875 / sequence_SO=supercontig / SO=protein_coding / is_pseudo=false